ncbi:MAG: SUMF1/EgtB/PvdO family nonheme iron enzyme [Sedimentisphaerales bacterium]|nr:SUMF1/EgtB/PvdO family nonheme iron enzyme [Sedimentisphaerales bacterium]
MVLGKASLTFLVGIVFAGSVLAADASYYQRKNSWQGTLRCSLEALSAWEEAHPEEDADKLSLGPWYVLGPVNCGEKGFDFSPGFETGRIDILQGYNQSLKWERAESHQDGVVMNLPGRNNAATFLCRTITVGAARQLAVYLGSDDGLEVYLNGGRVLSNNVPRGPGPNQDKADLPLKPGENQLLLKIYNRTGGHGYYFSTSPEPGRAADSPRLQRRDGLWKLVARDFPSEQAQRQIRLEQKDGIWDRSWGRGDIKELANRYARACRTKELQDEAAKLAAAGPEKLDEVRGLYYRSIALKETVDELAKLDIEPVKRAIRDLSESFPSGYKEGPALLTRLDELQKAYQGVKDSGDTGAIVKIGEEILALREKALLGNPLLDFDKLLVVKRSEASNHGLPQNWQGNCALPKTGYDNEIAVLSPVRCGGGLTTLYKPENGRFVGDVDLHFDAGKILFSMPGSHNRWQIWEIGIDGSGLRQVTPGKYNDVDNYDACYLADGRIIFDSTRCFQGVPCVGGGNTVANLCIMNADGAAIRQLCFDQDHNWCPTQLNNGRVLYSRWEYSDSPHYFTRLLFHMNPDGSNQMEYYGSNSPWPNSFFYAKPIPNEATAVVAVISGHHGVARMGELVIFDPARGRQQADGAVQRIPGYGKKVEAVITDQLVNESWPKFLHPHPLSEKYFLTAMQPDASSLWGIYLVDVFDNMLLLREEPGYRLFEPVPVRKRLRPPVVPDRVDPARQDALVYLSDIYAGHGLAGVPRGTVKKLRLYEYHYAYPQMGGHINIGIDGPWDVRRILGTVPVESDGSANFRVPANMPIGVQPLDENGRALQIMRSWFTAMPGETLSCVGCHESQSTVPAARPTIAAVRKPSEVEPWYGPARGFSFKREVQPVLEKYCVGCHNGEKNDRPNFTIDRPSPFRNFTPSYCELHPYVRRPGPESDYFMQQPLEYHASVSELIQMLEKGHHNAKPDAEAWDRLVTWIDLNVPDHGTWSEHRQIAGSFEQRRLEMRKLYANRPEQPEVYPPIQIKKAQFVRPAPVDGKAVFSAAVSDWPLSAEGARDRQGHAGPAKDLSFDLGEGVKLEMVLIPAGEFVMGSAEGYADEYPMSRVRIDKPFYMGKFEVTNSQYSLFDPTHRSGYISVYNKDQSRRGEAADGDLQPVIRVSWEESAAFCDWLSRKTGRKFVLPTEAEWEYACRAGSDTDMNYGGVAADFSRHANLADERTDSLTPHDSPKWIPSIKSVNDGSIVTSNVGRYQANAWGLHDMHGNVCEWTGDAYRPYPYNGGAGQASEKKVARGGSFYDRPKRARSSFRLGYPQWQRVFNVGFRVVCEAPSAVVKK